MFNLFPKKREYYYHHPREGINLKDIKEKKYPDEFAIIDFNEHAKENGYFEDHNREIYHYKNGEVYQKFPFLKSTFETIIIKNRLPFIDMTRRKMKLKVQKIIHPELIQYFEKE